MAEQDDLEEADRYLEKAKKSSEYLIYVGVAICYALIDAARSLRCVQIQLEEIRDKLP